MLTFSSCNAILPCSATLKNQKNAGCLRRHRGLSVWQNPYKSDRSYARSRVRTTEMQTLRKQLNPQAEQALARAAVLIRNDAGVLEQLTNASFGSSVILIPPERIWPNLDVLRRLHIAV